MPIDDAAGGVDTTTAVLSPGSGTSADDVLSNRVNDAFQRSQTAIGQFEKASSAEVEGLERKAKDLAPLRERAMQTISQPLPEPPKLQKPPEKPQQTQGADEGWLLAVQVLGALAGATTRRPLTNALAAMTGALQGYQEGNQQKFQNNLQIWDRENKAAEEANRTAMEEYKGILENRKLNQDQALMALQIAAARHEDEAMAQAARTKNTLVIAQLYDKQFQEFSKMKESADRLRQQHTTWRDQQFEQQAAQWVAQNPKVIDAMLQGMRPPPSTNDRTGYQGALSRAIWSELYARNPNFDANAYKQRSTVSNIEAAIPARRNQAMATAEGRTYGTAGANIDLVMRAVGPTIENAAEKASKVPATGFPRINTLLQTAASEIGDPNLRDFQLANLELAEQLARAMNPRSSVIAVATMNRAVEYLSTADSPEAYDRVLRNIDRFVEREQKLIEEAKRGAPMPKVNIPDSTQRRLPDSTPRQLLPETPKAFGGAKPGGLLDTFRGMKPTPNATVSNHPGYSEGRGLDFQPPFDPFGFRKKPPVDMGGGWKAEEVIP